ncbi:MAG: DEAD/DEAH box helicase family protein [Candidatus Electrothrix scaldis]|nr:MAG: DEAD/DEAH box helicase family protein [Candidatus Electrothrix sp. GW3-3]
MQSNFSYLKKDQKYADIMVACIEAEKSIAISYSAAALQTRRALEIAVKWAYQYDRDLIVPYRDNLSSLIHDNTFRDLLDPKLFPRIRFIITLGNKVAHTTKPVARVQVIESLHNLYDFISWIDFSYSTSTHSGQFNSALLSSGEVQEKKTRKMQEELAAKEAAWQAEKKQLEGQLQSEKERREHAEKRQEKHREQQFHCEDISEFATRKLYIDLALEMAGWEIGSTCLEEVKVQGMPNSQGIGFADYVLYADNGKALAVVEAKKTSVDPHTGKIQAKLYADCLAKEHGQQPVIFFTNGFETWFWDEGDYPERVVSGFFTKDELEWISFRKQNRQGIRTVAINDEISNRAYQKKAIQAVCDTLEEKQRKALLVMATGSGKTRVSISIVDVLQRYGWVKNVLFLADRVELVKQAKKNFVKLLPNLSTCNLLDSKDDSHSRMIFSTYPTMMNAIDATKSKDGACLFTPGHFDLIIIDESHRSIYKKYHDLFTYFDGFLLGLTATPKSDIEKNTYTIFDLEDGVPTFAYELDEAVQEGYLVPYSTVETKLKFVEEGISYDDLTDEEKEQWEETFEEGVREVASAALNTFLFNANTVDRVLQDLMERGIHVHGGDRIGKTIIFAANIKHAEFILRRCNTLYPKHGGRLAATIYNGVKYVDKVIENFSEKEKNPQIAVSVDMLDTGIDIPEIVNLVLFKKVRSKGKFWQMIGRGTRLCEDLFGTGQDKESFLIFDYCSNFEFFRADKKEVEARPAKSLTENLFNIRVKIAQELQQSDVQTDEYIAHRKILVAALCAEVGTIDEELFSSRMRIEFIHKYKKPELWESISDEMVRELEREVSPLLPAQDGNELAKRFDYLIYMIELAQLQGLPASKPRGKVMQTASRLDEKGHLAQIKVHAALIAEVQTGEYWERASIFDHEMVRTALRDLLVLLEKENTAIYYTSFADDVLEVAENPGEYGGNELQNYRLKVHAYLKKHQDDIVVHRLRNNEPLTQGDFRHIEKILWHDLGSEEDYRKTYGEEPLLRLVARLVGLERSTANELFSEFIADQSLNSKQMEFVHLIVNHVVENGCLEKAILNDHPFNKHGMLIDLFAGKLDVVQKIVHRIDELNTRLELEAA